MSSDFLTYNLTITNISPKNSGNNNDVDSQYAFISAPNNAPIIEKMEDYYGSVIRFSVPGLNLPLIQCLVQTPVLDINKLIYSFTLSYNNINSDQIFWEFQPELEPPIVNIPPSNTPQQTFSNYYFLYQYQSIINIMNVALKNALLNLKGKPGTGDIANSPDAFFYYDPNSNLIKLYTPPLFDTTDDQLSILISFNSVSSVFFAAMPYQFYGYNLPSGIDATIRVQNNKDINTATIDSVKYIITSQEFVSLSYMSYLKNIYIETNMPITSESTFINDPQAQQNVNYTSILIDYLPDLSQQNDAGIASKKFIYNAPSLYRMFEFSQRGPLYNLSANVRFSDNLGNDYPLYLEKGQAVDIKIMFVKKSVYRKS